MYPIHDKIRSISLIPSLLLLSAFSLYWRTLTYASIYSKTHKLVDYLDELCLILMTLSLITNSYRHRNEWHELCHNLVRIETKLNYPNKLVSQLNNDRGGPVICLIIANCAFFIILIADSTIWAQKMIADDLISYLSHFVCAYYYLNVCLVVYHIGGVLKSHYFMLNLCVANLGGGGGGGWKNVAEVYRVLRESVDLFNVILGWPLVLACAETVMHFLVCFDYMLTDYEDEFRTKIIVMNTLWCLYVMCGVSFAILSLSAVLEESEKTLKICYKLIEDDDVENHLSHAGEILRMTEQIGVNSPKFTAAGLFTINKGTLLAILSTTTTYLIILMQFKGV